MESLSFRLDSLVESNLAHSNLGGISFKYCPSCLTEIIETKDKSACNLCKTAIKGNERDFAYVRMMNELNFHIRESEALIIEYQRTVDKCNLKLPGFKRQISILKEEYNSLITFADNRGALIAEVSTEIGYHKNMMINLEEKMEFIDKVEKLQRKKLDAQESINIIGDKLEGIKIRNKTRFQAVYSAIENIALELLTKDGGEKCFLNPEYVLWDFATDTMAVNGRNKFSASSMVVLKNCIRISFFLHALNDEISRISNFLILDNIEDKGMVTERSQKFQRTIIEVCEKSNSEHQLIFTTSMIAEELKNYPYCVGPYYPEGSYTLGLL